MANNETLTWQKHQIAASRDALNYDPRAAAEEALRLGRPLTNDEFNSFRILQQTTVTPIKRLVYIGDKLVAA